MSEVQNHDFYCARLGQSHAESIFLSFWTQAFRPILYGIDVIVATRPFPETVNFACQTWYSRAVSIGSLNSKTKVQGPFMSSVGLNLIHNSKPRIWVNFQWKYTVLELEINGLLRRCCQDRYLWVSRTGKVLRSLVIRKKIVPVGHLFLVMTNFDFNLVISGHGFWHVNDDWSPIAFQTPLSLHVINDRVRVSGTPDSSHTISYVGGQVI